MVGALTSPWSPPQPPAIRKEGRRGQGRGRGRRHGDKRPGVSVARRRGLRHADQDSRASAPGRCSGGCARTLRLCVAPGRCAGSCASPTPLRPLHRPLHGSGVVGALTSPSAHLCATHDLEERAGRAAALRGIGRAGLPFRASARPRAVDAGLGRAAFARFGRACAAPLVHTMPGTQVKPMPGLEGHGRSASRGQVRQHLHLSISLCARSEAMSNQGGTDLRADRAPWLRAWPRPSMIAGHLAARY